MKTKHFVMDIQLGSASLETVQDIFATLARVAGKMADEHPPDKKLEPFHSRTIMNLDGTTVGSWNIEYREIEE